MTGGTPGRFVVLAACAALLAYVCPCPARAADVPDPSCLPGVYDGGQNEIAAGLELRAGGRFDYALGYGALNEESQGEWDADGDGVGLTSDAYTAPRFAFLGEQASPEDGFRVDLDVPDGLSRQYFDARITLADGRILSRQLSETGLVLNLEEGETPVSLRLVLPLFALSSDAMPLSGRRTGSVRVRFEPNDLGRVSFDQQRLRFDQGALVLDRHGRTIRFRPVQGGCKRTQAP